MSRFLDTTFLAARWGTAFIPGRFGGTETGPVVTIVGLTGGNAVVGDHASITMTVSTGTITARKWGSTLGGSEYGTGTSPTDFTAGEGDTLYATATVDAVDYSASASIVFAAPSAAAGIADQSYVEDSAISTLDVAADFTGSGITYALAPSSAALPPGLSLASNGQITGTPTTPAGQVNIVVRGTNSGGFDDTAFGVTITEVVASVPVSFGALTLAGAGGVAKPAGATSISNAGGTNLTLTSGFAVPATNGVTSGTVTWDDGTLWDVTALANTYSAMCDKTEIEAAHAHAVTNRAAVASTCIVREGDTTAAIDLTGSTFTGSFTLRGSGFSTNSAARPTGFTWGSRIGNLVINGDNVTVEDMRIGRDFNTDFAQAYVYHATGDHLTDFTLRRCEVFGTPMSTWVEELLTEGGTGSVSTGKIRSGYESNLTSFPSDGVLIEDCWFHDLRGPGALRGDNFVVQGNYGERMIGGGFGILPGDNQKILNNELIGLVTIVSDPGDVHGGLGGGTVQFSDAGQSCTNVVYKGNVMMVGNWRGAHEVSQSRSEPDMTGITGVKFNDVFGNAANYDGVEFSHNIVQVANGLGVTFENATNVKCHHNTLIGVRGSTDDLTTSTGQPGVYFEYFNSYSGASVQCYDNILAPDNGLTATVLADADGWTFYRNESVVNGTQSKAGVTEARTYDEYFTGHVTKGLGADLTPAEIPAAVTPKAFTRASSQNIGAVNSYYTIGIPGKGATDTTPSLTVPTSGASADATGHSYAKTVWNGTYGLELDADGRSGAIYDGATTATVANGKQVTFVVQGEFTGGDASEACFMDSNGQDNRTTRATTATGSNSRFEHIFSWATDNTKQASQISPVGRYNTGTGRFCYAVSLDLENDRYCVMRNGTVHELVDRATGFEIADALINLSRENVHFLETIFGTSRCEFNLEALIFENQFIDLHADSGDIIAQDGFLRSPTAIDTAFGREPLIFLQGNAAAFNAGNGNAEGRAQGVTVTNSGTVTDVTGSNVDEATSTATFTSSGGFRVAELTNGQTLVVTTGFTPTGIEMVGGGGGGGFRAGGGGGAGELVQITSSVPALSAQTYTATVGAGGSGGLTADLANTPTSGGNTRLIGGSTDDLALTAIGGGYGGSEGTARNGVYGLAAAGGSGGGSGPTNVAGRFGASTASDGVGNAGNNGNFSSFAGGGGGGAGGAGSAQAAGVAGAGGAGVASVTPGKSDTLAAGGGGGDNVTLVVGPAGVNFGDGGGGGSELVSGGAREGGAGAAGIIRVWWPV